MVRSQEKDNRIAEVNWPQLKGQQLQLRVATHQRTRTSDVTKVQFSAKEKCFYRQESQTI